MAAAASYIDRRLYTRPSQAAGGLRLQVPAASLVSRSSGGISADAPTLVPTRYSSSEAVLEERRTFPIRSPLTAETRALQEGGFSGERT